jgi:hypothetical protein
MATTKFVTGHNHASVCTDLNRDYGWKRVSRDVWEDDDGDPVKYLHSPSQLHGTRGALVYLAAGYDERDNWWALQDMMRSRECEIIEL